VLHKFNTLVRLCIVAFLIIPFPVLADHVPTQPAYGQDLTTDNNAGTITIGILGSDGWEDSPPENYTIFFSGSSGITETNSFCVTTSFGHQTNTWQYYTFSNDDLKYYFADLAGKNFYFRIRSNNETDNIVSTLTTESVYNIYAGPPFEFNQTDWSAPTGTDACNPYVVTTTTTVAPPTTESAAQEEVVEEETTTTSSTTTTTQPPPPPPPPPTTTTTLYVVVNEDGSTSEYTETEVEDGTVDRDNQRKDNEDKYGCYMTDAQIERGDCDIPKEEEVVEEKEEEVIIKEDEKEQPDTEEVISDDDVVVPEVVVEDKDEDFFDEPKEEVIEDELDQEIPGDDDIREEGIQEEDDKDQDNKEEEIKEEEEVEETKEIILEPEEEPEKFEEQTVQDLVKDIEEVELEDLETEQVIEVLTEVADVGVENLTEVSEDVLEVVSQVVEQSIQKAEELTEEQVEVVATVLNLEDKNDVKVIAEAVKNDEAVAEAVEEYVERAVENKDVEDYTLADVVTEIQTEQFLADPIGAFTDINIQEIDLGAIGNDMTNDQKEKAQEVVVPVIIASQIVASVQVVPVRMRRRI